MSVTTILTTAGVKLGTRLILSSFAPDLVTNTGVDLVSELTKHGMSKNEAKQKAESLQKLASQSATDVLKSLHDVELKNTNIQCVMDELEHGVVPALTPQLVVACGMDHAKVITEIKIKHTPKPGTFGHREQALYDRALDSMIKSFMPLIASTAAYIAERDREILSNQRDAQSGLSTLLNTLGLLAEMWSNPDQYKTRADILKYLDMVARHHGVLELFGVEHMPVETQQYALKTGLVHVSIIRENLTHQSGTPIAAGSPQQNNPLRLIIRGAAGSGKTTLMRSVTVRCAQACKAVISTQSVPVQSRTSHSAVRNFSTNDPLVTRSSLFDLLKLRANFAERLLGLDQPGQSDAAREAETPQVIPFLIRLRDCDNGRLPELSQFPRLSCGIDLGLSTKLTREILERGLGLVIFDGIDEVPPKERATLHQHVRNLIAAYPNSHYIMTSRPLAEGEPPWLAAEGFAEGRMEELSKEKRDLLIDRWHESVSEQLKSMKRSDPGLTKLPHKLKSALDNASAIARLATNPLMCAMICSLHRTQNTLPKNLNDLLNSLTDMLIYKRELHSPGFKVERFDDVYSRLPHQHRRNIMAHVAHFFVTEQASALDRDRVKMKIAEKLDVVKDFSSSDAESVLKGLTERCGLIRELSQTKIDFIHNTLKEYLAATRYLAEDKRQQLVECADDESRSNVVIFAVGAAHDKPEFTEFVINAIINRVGEAVDGPFNKPDESNLTRKAQIARNLTFRRAVVAVRAAQAAPTKLSPNLQRLVDQLTQRLFPPASYDIADALATVGESVVPHLDYNQGMHREHQALCARTLRLVGTEDARQRLEAYRVTKDPMVIRELARCMDPLSIPAVVPCYARTAEQSQLDYAQFNALYPHFSEIRDNTKEHVHHCDAIKGITGIEDLDLSETGLTDDGLIALADPTTGQRGLKRLALDRTTVTDHALRAVVRRESALARLEHLNLLETIMLEDPIGVLANASSSLRSLRHLVVNGRRIDDHAIERLVAESSPLRTLNQLTVYRAPLTDRALRRLIAGKNRLFGLRHLLLSGESISDRALDFVREAARDVQGLTSLGLDSESLGNSIAEIISRSKALSSQLTSLQLSGDALTGAGLTLLADEHSVLNNLQSLVFIGDNLDEGAISKIIGTNTALRNLQSLTLQTYSGGTLDYTPLLRPETGVEHPLHLELHDLRLDDRALNSIRKVHPTWLINGRTWSGLTEEERSGV